jgi:hypothetical protein
MVSPLRFNGHFAIHGPVSDVKSAAALVRNQLIRNGEVYIAEGPIQAKTTTSSHGYPTSGHRKRNWIPMPRFGLLPALMPFAPLSAVCWKKCRNSRPA